MDPRRPPRPSDELFLSKPASNNAPDPDVVGPLRINKASSPEPRTGSAKPFAVPASVPLPYPDDTFSSSSRGHSRQPSAGRVMTPPSESESRSKNSTPADGRGRQAAGYTAVAPQPSSTRAKFSANDPHRPTAAGYGYTPYAPAAPGSHEMRPKPLPDSPGPEPPEKDDDTLFQQSMARPTRQDDGGRRPSASYAANPYPDYHQQYWPPPSTTTPPKQAAIGGGALNIPNPAGVNRLSSTASTSTTRAQRGSPPPPETPVESTPAAGGIEARYAAAGIAGTNTLTGMQSAAAAQRTAQYPAPNNQNMRASPAQQPQQQQPPRRPWTPTEAPGPGRGDPVVYQGQVEITPGQGGRQTASPQRIPPNRQAHIVAAERPLEHDMQRLNVEDAPPAYSSLLPGPGQQSRYPNEKGQMPGAAASAPVGPGADAGAGADPVAGPGAGAGAGAGVGPGAVAGAGAVAAGAAAVAATGVQPSGGGPVGHPAFANMQNGTSSLSPQPGPSQVPAPAQVTLPSISPLQVPASPPPLPEGWIHHLDPNSGQYYYIHLPTQATQWEFPTGPQPLNLHEPLSPTGTFSNAIHSPVASGKQSMSLPLASMSGLPVQQHATFRPESMMSMQSMNTPTTAGFTGPPPSAGIDMYRVQPTNGVYFGPYLRYTNMDIENGMWLGSILLVTDAPQPPTIHIHQSTDLSPNPRQLKGNPIYSHQRWMFFRYDVDLRMDEAQSVKWTYAITSHLGCTRYEFVVAGRHETSWRFICHSGNDFGLGVSQNERGKLGGLSYMWKDILQKHIECNGFHAQLGLGDQIYADRMWKEVPLLRQWTSMSGKENRKNAAWTAKHEEVSHAYFHYYTSHFDQPCLREAFAQIPHVLTLDDHDIFDGFGSYPEYMQFSNMFKNIGRIGIEMYLLFQHHTTLDILRHVNSDMDLFTITGTGWHFVKFLGPAVVVVGPDCRSERNPHQVMAGPTYQGLFPKIATLPPCVQHCIWMIPVPIVYPRLESMESLANTVATGKKAMTGTFNMVGRVVGGVAGVVGAKGMVGEGFNSVKKAVGKSGLMSGVLSPFGEIDVLDELRDMWTHDSKDLERTYFIRTLQGISHNKSLRMSIFSGSVSVCGAGLLHDPAHPSDHKTMYQIISSAVVDAPPSNYLLRLLHNNKALYVPANGHRHRSTHAPSDTKEDMMEMFLNDVNGQPRELRKLMARRNYVACVAFDPEVVHGAFGHAVVGANHGSGRLSLAVDFLVQADGGGGYGGVPMKYGPVVIPHLEYGR